MAPKWLRVATMRRPGSFAPRFSISLIPADIPGSFFEFRFLRLIRRAVGEGLYGPPVPGPTTGAPPEPTREHRKGTPLRAAVCSSRSPHRFSILLIPPDIPGSLCEFRFLRLIRSAVGEGLLRPSRHFCGALVGGGLHGPPAVSQEPILLPFFGSTIKGAPLRVAESGAAACASDASTRPLSGPRCGP